jgi:alginate O-acetyltransferase complex protein AlgI
LQKNYVSFGTYVTFFPQLIAGPIVRYRDIDDQLSVRNESVSMFADGVRRFCCGLAKKVLLGDMLFAGHEYYKQLQTAAPSVLGAWMTVILFTLHLYFDFSGYSDMAIGLGKMLGFRFPENFNYPYISKSITEFWRRWHISVSTWFREYVYIPLGGNRHGLAKQIRNLAIVWLLTGFWHGANWNFLLWGAYFAVILIVEKCFLLRFLEKLPAVLRHLYAVLLVLIGFLIFSYTDPSAGWSCFLSMLGVGVGGFSTPVATYQLLRLLPLLAIAIVGATPLPKKVLEKLCAKCQWLVLPLTVAGTAMVLLCVAYMVDSTFSPFAYTQF